MIYLLSDGYQDQFGGPEGKKFKSKNLKELLLSVHEKPMSEQKEALENKLFEWMGEIKQVDDISLMGVKF
jgi:serine phosphatase RsbU (regulator of sigma subunit)